MKPMKPMLAWLCAPVVLALAACSGSPSSATPQQYEVTLDKAVVKTDYQVPAQADLAEHENKDLIVYGGRLLNETKRLLPNNVGASMNCYSCHIANGKEQKGAPYVNSYYTYPKKMPRAGKVVDLEMRINGCFQRQTFGREFQRNEGHGGLHGVAE